MVKSLALEKSLSLLINPIFKGYSPEINKIARVKRYFALLEILLNEMQWMFSGVTHARQSKSICIKLNLFGILCGNLWIHCKTLKLKMIQYVLCVHKLKEWSVLNFRSANLIVLYITFHVLYFFRRIRILWMESGFAWNI